mmetsp:Transcript_49778/g.159024  ORF Transcript_49778/g.159024 Transcript_49778/m.159024 type:complete len:363 (+) Transcript_49778:490-1578(+)
MGPQPVPHALEVRPFLLESGQEVGDLGLVKGAGVARRGVRPVHEVRPQPVDGEPVRFFQGVDVALHLLAELRGPCLHEVEEVEPRGPHLRGEAGHIARGGAGEEEHECHRRGSADESGAAGRHAGRSVFGGLRVLTGHSFTTVPQSSYSRYRGEVCRLIKGPWRAWAPPASSTARLCLPATSISSRTCPTYASKLAPQMSARTRRARCTEPGAAGPSWMIRTTWIPTRPSRRSSAARCQGVPSQGARLGTPRAKDGARRHSHDHVHTRGCRARGATGKRPMGCSRPMIQPRGSIAAACLGQRRRAAAWSPQCRPAPCRRRAPPSRASSRTGTQTSRAEYSPSTSTRPPRAGLMFRARSCPTI